MGLTFWKKKCIFFSFFYYFKIFLIIKKYKKNIHVCFRLLTGAKKTVNLVVNFHFDKNPTKSDKI